MNLGGSLFPDAAFKKILSIGYEFETGDLAKLSLHDDKTTLINSDISLRLLKDKMSRGSIKIVDGNYLHVRIPIKKEGEPDVVIEPELTEQEDEETLEFLREMMEEAPEEYEREQAEKERRLTEALARKENDSYLEYFNENRKRDNPEVVKFQITNDLGDNAFAYMVSEKCETLTIPKNEMFFFKTKKGKLYPIKFSESIAKNSNCQMFSGVEFVITYYNPKRDNPNIIVETFIDACSRIIDHLGNLKTIQGELLLQNDEKTDFTQIGVIGDERNIYHKPNTNLFYMDTYDNVNTQSLQHYGNAEFIPQMTFRCKAPDVVDVMKEILVGNPAYKKGKSLNMVMEYDLICIKNIENGIDKLLIKYNENDANEIKLDVSSDLVKTIKTYLVLIYYKIYMFTLNHVNILSTKDYLKDHLAFGSRHSNGVLYRRIKEILKTEYKIVDSEKIAGLFFQPDVFNFLYDPIVLTGQAEVEEEPDENDYNEDGSYKYNITAYKDSVEEYSNDFGNPLFSLSSYFQYLESKGIDWFSSAKYDVFSTTFDLNKDEVLLENRSFRFAIELYLRNTLPFDVTKETMTIKDMHNIVNELYGKKVQRLMTLYRNPSKGKLSRKKPRQKPSSGVVLPTQPGPAPEESAVASAVASAVPPLEAIPEMEEPSPEQMARFEPIEPELTTNGETEPIEIPKKTAGKKSKKRISRRTRRKYTRRGKRGKRGKP